MRTTASLSVSLDCQFNQLSIFRLAFVLSASAAFPVRGFEECV